MGEEFSASKKTALGGWQGWLTVFWGFLFLYFFDAVSTVIKALRAGLSGAGLVWTVAFGVVGVFSFIAAVSLVYVRPNAVTTAKLFLLAQATFALALYIKVLFGSGATLNSAQQFTRNILIPSLLFTVVWYIPNQVQARSSDLFTGLFFGHREASRYADYQAERSLGRIRLRSRHVQADSCLQQRPGGNVAYIARPERHNRIPALTHAHFGRYSAFTQFRIRRHYSTEAATRLSLAREHLRSLYGNSKTPDSPCWTLNKRLAHASDKRSESHDYTALVATLAPTILNLVNQVNGERTSS
jgi:hypothetical protein